jgi:hypothetical protein
MLRQGRQVVSSQREYDIVDPGFGRIKGSLQLQLQNIGKTPAVVDFGLAL